MIKIVLCILAAASVVIYAALTGGPPPTWTHELWFLTIPVIAAALLVTAFLFYGQKSVEEFFAERPKALRRCRAVHAAVTVWFLSPILGNGLALALRWSGFQEAANLAWDVRWWPFSGALMGAWALLALILIMLIAGCLLVGVPQLAKDIYATARASIAKWRGQGPMIA